jgi:hypothetical protein
LGRYTVEASNLAGPVLSVQASSGQGLTFVHFSAQHKNFFLEHVGWFQ